MGEGAGAGGLSPQKVTFTDGALELIARGAKVNDPGPAGETPLISAVHQKNLELARALIAAWREAAGNQPFASAVSPQPGVCDLHLAPRQRR